MNFLFLLNFNIIKLYFHVAVIPFKSGNGMDTEPLRMGRQWQHRWREDRLPQHLYKHQIARALSNDCCWRYFGVARNMCHKWMQQRNLEVRCNSRLAKKIASHFSICITGNHLQLPSSPTLQQSRKTLPPSVSSGKMVINNVGVTKRNDQKLKVYIFPGKKQDYLL